MTTYMLPYMRWTTLCNGIPIAELHQAFPVNNGFILYDMTVLGNGRYKSAATRFTLRMQEMQWLREGELALAQAAFEVDGMPVGNWTPFLIHTGVDWPSAPVALLHWVKHTQVYDYNGAPTAEYERFSLMGEIVK